MGIETGICSLCLWPHAKGKKASTYLLRNFCTRLPYSLANRSEQIVTGIIFKDAFLEKVRLYLCTGGFPVPLNSVCEANSDQREELDVGGSQEINGIMGFKV